MIVVGGIYGERCVVPDWRQVFGSGGRAAAAMSGWGAGVTLHGYCSEDRLEDIRATMAAFNVDLVPTTAPEPINFYYFHPLSNPEIDPPPANISRQSSIHVSGEVVLRFGMMEGDAVVRATTAVYDPQSGLSPEGFSANGSTADRLAIILNEGELGLLTGKHDVAEAAQTLMVAERADVLVVKAGTRGATIWTKEGASALISVYRSERVFKIGSGDVFSAAFTWFWGKEGRDPVEAADLASRSVACYCNTRHLPLPDPKELAAMQPLRTDAKPGKIYLAGPFFDIGQRWVIEEALTCLRMLGAQVFSPLHEVGFGDPDAVAKEDLKGLECCDAVLAIVNGGDPGTLFEIGYARDRGMPVVALAEDVHDRDLTMVAGSGCEVARDLASAIYRAVWASMK